jgi:hypothetical protein
MFGESSHTVALVTKRQLGLFVANVHIVGGRIVPRVPGMCCTPKVVYTVHDETRETALWPDSCRARKIVDLGVLVALVLVTPMQVSNQVELLGNRWMVLACPSARLTSL